MSSYYGSHLHVSIFGQSHSPAIGVSIDGLPAGEVIDLDMLHAFLKRRAPGQSPTATPRMEEDMPEILSGLFHEKTCGAPLAAVIHNNHFRSRDYNDLNDLPRPGHADYTAAQRYKNHQDYRGGGHFSGRLTAPICIAGGICMQILARRGVSIGAHILSIGAVQDRPFQPLGESFDHLSAGTFPVLNHAVASQMEQAILQAKENGDSLGGIVECMVQGFPAGIGNPMFSGLENKLASALFAIPAVKGVDFGAGFDVATMTGSTNNDPFVSDGGTIRTLTNHHGGILGGISSGMPILMRAAFKPTPSISIKQQTVRLSSAEAAPLEIQGRHDPCIVPRAVPVVEAAVAIALLDSWLESGHPLTNEPM